MSKIWSFLIIVAIIFSAFTGNLDKIIDYITNAASNSIESILTLASMTCFWTGVFNVLKNTPLIGKLADITKGLTAKLFKKEEVDDMVLKDVALNITSNAIGVGNAATVYGIDAIKKMQAKNKIKNSPNDSMAVFILLNTASIQILPTSIISLRAIYGSRNPGEIILAVWIVTVAGLLSGLASIKILNKVIKQ